MRKRRTLWSSLTRYRHPSRRRQREEILVLMKLVVFAALVAQIWLNHA